jgi:uncharacterized protein (UPF0264 family)
MSPNATLPGLLVSVRSAEEARAALAGGADLIDVKEPTRGPLGRADDEVIVAVVDEVRGRVPVSVAMGEWTGRSHLSEPRDVAYLKWGLARLASEADPAIYRIARTPRRPLPVLVAYADHERAESPLPTWLARKACELRFAVFLIDTAIKDGSSLLDWIEPATLAHIRFALADAGVRIALAGSLDVELIRRIRPLAPDWFAVRGAACMGGRGGIVSEERVRLLKSVIAGEGLPTTLGSGWPQSNWEMPDRPNR